jgi:hypothetical protein
MAYALNGFGLSLQDAQANGFVANYKDNAAAKMGILHAAYGKSRYTYCVHRVSTTGLLHCVNSLGAGALTSPLIATQFAQLHRWSFHYLTSLAVAMLNTVLLVCIFKFKTQDGKCHSFLQLKDVIPHVCAAI